MEHVDFIPCDTAAGCIWVDFLEQASGANGNELGCRWIGNYLPKCRQNYTIGIRVKWAVENEENWNATHRFAGKVWAVGGVLMMGCSFLPEEISIYVFVALTIGLSLLSAGYSYYFYKVKQGK